MSRPIRQWARESGEFESCVTKKKAPSKTAVKKPAKKRSGKAKKPKDLAEARKDITEIVRAEATLMAKAVVVEALKGQLAHMKYLFEVSGLYPANLGAEAKPGEDSLALTLLKRMGLPVDPVNSSEEATPAGQEGEERNPAGEESGARNSEGVIPQNTNGQNDAAASEGRTEASVIS